MSVQTFDPDKQITLTSAAIDHLVHKLQEAPDAQGIRLSIRPSGCSGYMYELDYVSAPEQDDITLEINQELTLYIEQESLPLIKGTLVDFVKQGLNASIQFRNPNATGECGCGESFTVN